MPTLFNKVDNDEMTHMAYKVCEMSHYVKVGLVFVFIE
jgi:hypothetical protein